MQADGVIREQSAPRQADKVLLATRVLAAIIIPFLVVAAIILLLLPDETDRLFAWAIGPPMTAMALGATYTGGIVFFTRVILARRWSDVALGFPPVIGFAGLLGVVTVIHWDRFDHEHVAFWTWATLYFTTPFLVLLVWRRNASLVGSGVNGESRMPSAVRALLAGLGVVLGLVSLALLLVPETMADLWAWTLSPLTARVMAAAFFLPALLKLAVALDGRWRTARVPLEAEIVALALVALSALRARGDFDGRELEAAGFAAGLVGLLAVSVFLYVHAIRSSSDGEGAAG